MAILSNDSTTGSRKILNSDNYQYNLSSYSNLIEAILDIGGEDATLYVSRGRWDADGVVVPENIHLLFDKGGILVGDCEINGSIEAGTWQIFDVNDTVFLTGMTTIYPEWFGAVGDGKTLDTAAINRAITSLGKRENSAEVVFSRDYLVHIEDPTFSTGSPWAAIQIPVSNVCLKFMSGSTLRLKPTYCPQCRIIYIDTQYTNIRIEGATIIGDRYEHDYSVSGYVNEGGWSTAYQTHEFGHGIYITGTKTSRITISDCIVKNCIGDGITTYYSCTMPSNININKCVFDNNRRQGCSLILCNGIYLRDCVFSNTNGTPPQSGIDIEPNRLNEVATNVYIYNCESINNKTFGLIISLLRTEEKNKIYVNGLRCENNLGGVAIYTRSGSKKNEYTLLNVTSYDNLVSSTFTNLNDSEFHNIKIDEILLHEVNLRKIELYTG